MTREISFEVYGDANDIEWDASEWADVDSQEEFEKQLISLAEEQATWGVRLVGVCIEDLWEEVLRAKELEDQMDDHYEDHRLQCEIYSLRRKWMGVLGFSDMEVNVSVRNDPPTSLAEEQKQLEAAERLKNS